MATQETQLLDETIVNTRRKMLTLGGAALATLAFGAVKAANAATIGDSDILNFALNLEYLEANFYTLATMGTTIDQVGVGIGAGATSGKGTAVVTTKGTNNYASCAVPWTIPVVQAYANETAAEERTHVTFLRSALNALATPAAVAQPPLDLYNSFIALGNAIGVSNFDPFASDANFLLGAYIFEDVGVTAYAGAAGLITTTAYLTAAAGILAVEAYHAGLVRTSIFNIDTLNGNTALQTLTQKISAARQNDGVGADDNGVAPIVTPLNNASTTATGITLADVNPANSLAYTRTTSAVLQVVTGATTSVYKGLFFPSGMNGLIQ